jgi:hypothetical protein
MIKKPIGSPDYGDDIITRETVADEDLPFVAESVASILKAEAEQEHAIRERDFVSAKRLKLTIKHDAWNLWAWLVDRGYGEWRWVRGQDGEYIVRMPDAHMLVFRVGHHTATLRLEPP